MKLLRMTATFGRLEQETLSLTEGLNVLQMPNEAGKSTWAEFLLAMLYGVDTSEREKTGVLPVKTKYQPWSGKPMEGVIELEHAGRRITLTRTSTARAPLGVFSAVYTDSGLPVEGMTGANCGETLLGVPKRVYQRSAFVRQAGLGLTPDDELEARLSALVTTGDEAVSFAAADKRLLAWQNRVRHNKTGLIPDAERELAAVDSALAALAGEHEKNLALRAQLQSLQAQQTACEEDLRALQAAQAQRKKAQLYDAKRAAMQAANRENAASAVCARLPREDALAVLSQEAAALLALPEQEPAASAPARPDCPQAFSGVDEERLLDKAQRDMREFDRMTAKKHRPSVPFWVLAALFAGLGAAGWFVRHEPLIPAAFALAALVCAVAALGNAAHDRRREAELSEAQALLTLYENHSRDEFYAYAVQYRDALRAWQAACEAASAQNAARDAESRLRAERTAALLGSVRMFAEAGTVREAQNAIASALAAYRAWHEAEQTAQQEAQVDAPPVERPLTELQKQAVEIAKRYETLSMQEKIGVIAQAFGCTSGTIETSPCTGKWRGTSDISIRFDNGSSLFLGNHMTRQAKTKKVQQELVDSALVRYNPEIIRVAKETAYAALKERELQDNAIAGEKGLKPYTLLNVEFNDGADQQSSGYIGWYYVTLAVDGKICTHLETGLNHDIASGSVSPTPTRENYYAAGALKESDVDYVFNNVGFSSASGLYSLHLILKSSKTL